MTITFIGIVITAIAIEADKFTQFQYYSFPLIALAGVLMVIISLAV